MGLLPDVDENGKLKDFDQVPRLYEPKVKHFSLRLESALIRKDTLGTRFKDAPTMADIHECDPDIYSKCFICQRPMPV